MLNFLKMIADFIGFCIQAIGMLFAGLFSLITTLPQMITFALSFVTYIPPFLMPFFFAGISIAPVMMLLNRRNAD